MTKLEQVARAIAECDSGCYLNDAQLAKAARLAVETLRDDPGDTAIVIGDVRILEHLNSREITLAAPTPAQNCFTAMLDAILNEKPK